MELKKKKANFVFIAISFLIPVSQL